MVLRFFVDAVGARAGVNHLMTMDQFFCRKPVRIYEPEEMIAFRWEGVVSDHVNRARRSLDFRVPLRKSGSAISCSRLAPCSAAATTMCTAIVARRGSRMVVDVALRLPTR